MNYTTCLIQSRIKISVLSHAKRAIYSFVRQFAFVDIDWFRGSPYARINGWLDEFLDSSLFASVMQKYSQWQPGDEAVVF